MRTTEITCDVCRKHIMVPVERVLITSPNPDPIGFLLQMNDLQRHDLCAVCFKRLSMEALEQHLPLGLEDICQRKSTS